MKSTLLVLSLSFSIVSFAQRADTLIGKKDGKTIIVPSTAIAITPIEMSINGDSCFSIGWTVNNLSRDTTLNSELIISWLDKVGNPLSTTKLELPFSITNKPNFRTLIDNFIINRNKRLLRK